MTKETINASDLSVNDGTALRTYSCTQMANCKMAKSTYDKKYCETLNHRCKEERDRHALGYVGYEGFDPNLRTLKASSKLRRAVSGDDF